MCLIAFAWKAHPDYPLIVAANRDEWRARPTEPAAWWTDAPSILAGRDLEAGGTWLGVTSTSRFAALTNFRDPSNRKADAPSRGLLVRDYLAGSQAPREFLSALRESASRYQGFNLLVGDRESLFYFSSRIGEILPVSPGVHALSNHTLDEPWPKAQKAKSLMDAALRPEVPWKARQSSCFDLLLNEETPPDRELPDTGVGMEWERRLSPILITGEGYGTRSSTVLLVGAGGHECHVEERTRAANGEVTAVARYDFPLA